MALISFDFLGDFELFQCVVATPWGKKSFFAPGTA
jgi:hypothetical protein